MALVRAAKKLGIPSVYFFPPAKWARHPWEVKEAARTITKVCATFESTVINYRSAGANVEFVGHPIIDECKPGMSSEELYGDLDIDKERDLITLMPGSREREVEYLLPTLIDTALLINKRIDKKPQFIVPIARATYEILKNKNQGEIFKSIEKYKDTMDIRLIIGRTIDVLSISKIAVIASGTATLEAAYLKIPMVLVYRVSFFTGFIARKFKSLPPYFGLPNLILKKKFIPELIQEDLKAERVAVEVMKILSNKEKYYYIKRCLARVSEKLGQPGVNKKVARIIIKVCKDNKKGLNN
jgi:lipid-A-disaccharide synthase